MARIRTIKPEFFTSEDIVALSAFARLLYQGLWCEADREGRLRWRPLTFKMRYLPADDVDIKSLCDELLAQGLVVLYGDGLAYIPSFTRHQHINPREAASVLPAPADSTPAPVVTHAPRVPDASPRVPDVPPSVDDEPSAGDDECQSQGKAKAAKFSARSRLADAGVADGVIDDWLAHRKAKKATVTETVITGIEREAAKAGISLQSALEAMCQRGWTGFKAEWVATGAASQPQPQRTGRAAFLASMTSMDMNFTKGDCDAIDAPARVLG